MEKSHKIFLSYSRTNKDVVDQIEEVFGAVGITLIRDIREVPYRGSFKEFMDRIGDMDFVMMVISDQFLQSEYCMYEVMNLLNTNSFEIRILPVVLEDANVIHHSKSRTKYYDFWIKETQEAEERALKYKNSDFANALKRYQSISHCLPDFFTKLDTMNTSGFEDLKKENFKPILNILLIDESQLLQEVIAIDRVKDAEEKAVNLEAFLRRNPRNKHGLFLRARIEQRANLYHEARRHFEELIVMHPGYDSPYISLGILLSEHFRDLKNARDNFETGLRLDERNATAHYNLGKLIGEMKGDYRDAKMHYEAAISINPQFAEAHTNLAELLITYGSHYNNAREHLEIALQVNPMLSEAYLNLGFICNRLGDYRQARGYYEKSIEVNPSYATAYNNLGSVLQNQFKEYEGAKKQFELALSIRPDYAVAQINLDNLLKKYYSGNKLKNKYAK